MNARARCWIALALGSVVLAGPARASGFSIFEQAAKPSGQAGAWVARADDASANWYNPAALLGQEGSAFQIGTNYIAAGSDSKFTVTDPVFLVPFTGSAAPQTFDAESNAAFPSHLYFSSKASERVAWGVGINNPFGLITEWSEPPVTVSARKSELVTYVVNPNVAFAIGGGWSVAVGADYILADVKEFSRDVNVGPAIVSQSNLTGDGDDWGYNFAVHHPGERFSFGLTYRSEMSPEIEGDLEFTNPAIPDTTGSATIDLPAQAQVGVAWHASDAWDVELDVAYAGWSSFENLVIDVDTGTDIVLEENWDDTFSYRVGAAWGLADAHELRFGAVYDEAPIPANTLRPSIPDADRTGATVGYGYTKDKWGVDAYLMGLWFDDATASGDPAAGVIDGVYENSTMLLGASLNVRF
jgi:long-chain fatty acid transport protein